VWIASVLDLQRVWQLLTEVNYPLALTSIIPVLASHWMRAWRWRTMLRAAGVQPIGMLNLFSAVMVGYTANNIIPRSGELLRPYVLAKREGISGALLLASVVAERLFDVVQLLLFLALALVALPELVYGALPNWMLGEGMRSLAIVVALLVVVIVVLGLTSLGERLAVRILRTINPALAERVAAAAQSFRRGLRIMRNGRDVARLVAESLAIWLLYAAPLWIVLYAVPMSPGGGHQWTFIDAFVLLLVVAVGTTIAPTPGAIGVVHALVAEAMNHLYGVKLEDAFVYITVAHALNYISVMVVGGAFVAREGISLAGIVRGNTTAEIAQTATVRTDA
jgi:uncharacterized protein (TIRG00374 family)